MKSKCIDLFEAPMAAMTSLRKSVTILQWEDGAVELHLAGKHLATWEEKRGWMPSEESGSRS